MKLERRGWAKWLVPAAALLVIGLSFWLDAPVQRWLSRPIESGQVKATLQSLRAWGEGPTLVIVSIGILCVAPSLWRQVMVMLAVTLLSSILVDSSKPLFDRPRPLEVGRDPADRSWRNSSFPSGHTATAFAFSGQISLLFPTLRPVALLAASGTALSRMYDQRHYLSDCVAGALFGWFFAQGLFRAIFGGLAGARRTTPRVLDSSERSFSIAALAASLGHCPWIVKGAPALASSLPPSRRHLRAQH